MRILTIAFLAVSSLLLPRVSAAAEKDSSSVSLCIAMPVNHSFLNTSTVVSQNRLVHDVNQATQKKNAKMRVDAVPVEDADLAGIRGLAR